MQPAPSEAKGQGVCGWKISRRHGPPGSPLQRRCPLQTSFLLSLCVSVSLFALYLCLCLTPPETFTRQRFVKHHLSPWPCARHQGCNSEQMDMSILSSWSFQQGLNQLTILNVKLYIGLCFYKYLCRAPGCLSGLSVCLWLRL